MPFVVPAVLLAETEARAAPASAVTATTGAVSSRAPLAVVVAFPSVVEAWSARVGRPMSAAVAGGEQVPSAAGRALGEAVAPATWEAAAIDARMENHHYRHDCRSHWACELARVASPGPSSLWDCPRCSVGLDHELPPDADVSRPPPFFFCLQFFAPAVSASPGHGQTALGYDCPLLPVFRTRAFELSSSCPPGYLRHRHSSFFDPRKPPEACVELPDHSPASRSDHVLALVFHGCRGAARSSWASTTRQHSFSAAQPLASGYVDLRCL